MSERVLDIGIGGGGSYINSDRRGVKRVGLDLELPFLRGLIGSYPSVLPIAGSAEHLPFSDNSFKRIETVLPERDLALPGLEIEHPRVNSIYTDEYKTTLPNGWYPELARVLSPGGILLLIGDLFYLPSIQQTSSSHFTIQSTRQMTLDEFKDLGTPRVRKLLEKYFYGSYTPEQRREFRDGLVEIVMINKKA